MTDAIERPRGAPPCADRASCCPSRPPFAAPRS